MALEEYKKKRDFTKTSEPAGAPVSGPGGFAYVIQKHAATRLHYDFRLELDGVLMSWAVPKGPSLDPAEKRLAAHVEDHPIEYGTFEGVIPKGEYGGGTVMLWDRGHWIPEGDPHAGYKKGDLKFRLEGEKLSGSFVLVRMRPRPQDNPKSESWLLIKHRDDAARPLAEYDVLEELPDSVATGRSMDEIAAARDRVWSSKQKGGGPLASGIPDPAEIPGARKASLPAKIGAELATLVEHAPDSDDWLHEIKFDGFRILSRAQRGKARLLTRNDKDWTERFSVIADAVQKLPVDDVILDGEVVVLLENGTSSFQALQNASSSGQDADLTYFVFDILHLNGYDLRGVNLEERKRVLRAVLGLHGGGRLRFSDHVIGNGVAFHAQACNVGVEGIISKRRDSVYKAARGRDWLKVKCVGRQEFVIGGYSEPGGSRKGFGALLLGVYDGKDLQYVGRVGTGFNDKLLHDLSKRLKQLEIDEPAFVNPPLGAEARGVHWVDPRLVGEVQFIEWTGDNVLRHPSFLGLREDKDASSVVRESKASLTAEDKDSSTAEDADNADNNEEQSKNLKKTTVKKSSKRTTKASAKKAASSASSAVIKKPAVASRTKTSKGGTFDVAGVTLSSPDKIYYPGENLTKRDVALYYERIWPWIEPHISGRPLTIVRCPEGYLAECFYQKHADKYMPEGIVHRVRIKETKEARDYLWIDSLQGLLTLIQLGTLELHTWQSHVDKLEKPDRMVLDLDPGEDVVWNRVAEAAVLLKLRLDELDLESFVKTTGGKGLHVVVPLARRNTWEDIVNVAHALSAEMVNRDPKRFLLTMTKSARKGKIYLDYLRNPRGSTSIEAYSTRARSGAPVSAPIRWEELAGKMSGDMFTIENLPDRMDELDEDPWNGYFDVKQSLTAEIKKELGVK
jgi:bifunctional non-homologous end joining protein LigD